MQSGPRTPSRWPPCKPSAALTGALTTLCSLKFLKTLMREMDSRIAKSPVPTADHAKSSAEPNDLLRSACDV